VPAEVESGRFNAAAFVATFDPGRTSVEEEPWPALEPGRTKVEEERVPPFELGRTSVGVLPAEALCWRMVGEIPEGCVAADADP